MAGTTTQPTTHALAPEQAERIDGYVERARIAADAFRALDDQVAVDRIVHALVVAGLEHAVELARLAMEDTGFGVFEDKVVKNYIATEFLNDYLKDKRSVGVIEEDAARAVSYIAEPIGVVLALTPITNPTSTVLFKAVVAAKTRNAMIFRPSARAARCAQRTIELLQAAGEAAGMPPDTLQVIPDPTLDVSQFLFHHPEVDFIWTTGGPKAVAAANASGKPCLSVGAGNAPVYVHRSADVEMAAVDMLISKTFDASVICPAEQTCIIDEPMWDAILAELQRLGARLLSEDEVAALSAAAFDDGAVQLQTVGQSCLSLAGIAGFEAGVDDKVLLAPLPSDLNELVAHPLAAEKLMPVLGLVRSPSVDHAIAAAEAITELGGLGHTSAVYATDDDVIEAFSARVRTGRILVNAPTAVGALGGVYNAVGPAQLCAIFGVGGLGHLAVQYAKIQGATVVAVDLEDDKLEMEKDLGADHLINAGEQDPATEIQKLGGAEAALALAVAPRPFEQAFDSLARGGTLMMVALPHDNYVRLPIFETVLRGINIKGWIVGTHRDVEDVYTLHTLGRTRVLRETRPLEEVNEAFDDVEHARNKQPRVVFTV